MVWLVSIGILIVVDIIIIYCLVNYDIDMNALYFIGLIPANALYCWILHKITLEPDEDIASDTIKFDKLFDYDSSVSEKIQTFNAYLFRDYRGPAKDDWTDISIREKEELFRSFFSRKSLNLETVGWSKFYSYPDGGWDYSVNKLMKKLKKEGWFESGYIKSAYLPSLVLCQQRGWKMWEMRIEKTPKGKYAWIIHENEKP